MKIVFMGTPDFAVPCLQALLDESHTVLGVFTQPDRPKGRGQKMVCSAVKNLAVANDIPVYQPEKIKEEESVQLLKEINPDIIIVVAFGQILSQEILDIPQYGCINVHASLLPKYRGAAPINWVLINGEKITGVTTMYMSRGLDTGDMLLKEEIEIPENYTAIELHDTLSILGAKILVETVDLLEKGQAIREEQNHSETCYSPMLSKALGKIDWTNSANSIRNLIRGCIPWPCAYTRIEGKVVKLYKAEVVKDITAVPSGTLYKVDTEAIYVKCGVDSLKITELQFENEKRMTVESYLRGHKINENIGLE